MAEIIKIEENVNLILQNMSPELEGAPEFRTQIFTPAKIKEAPL